MTKPSDIPTKKLVVETKQDETPKPTAPKKPFVRKEHLSNRDLRNHAGLITLKKALESATPNTKKETV